MFKFPWKLVNWTNSIFLIGCLLLTLTAVPLYIFKFGVDAFQVWMFAGFFIATGLSITLGYHRLFSHRAFKAKWPVRLFTLVFGAAAFENSALNWTADHRQHHKFTDQEEDPYDISRGFFHAHMGWILFKLMPPTPLKYVNDLRQDKLVMWQHNNYVAIAVFTSFVLPALLGFLAGGWVGALGGLLISGIARTVCVQQLTFFINSLCHTIGRQPYSSRCTARDSAIMAVLTFGEGYHNFHHSFQHDYRNGVKPWQFDPTKWAIWTLSKLGLVGQLRRVPEERILLSQIAEEQRQLEERLNSAPHPVAVEIRTRIQAAKVHLEQASQQWEQIEAEYQRAIERKIEASREKISSLRKDFLEARERLFEAVREWKETHRFVEEQFAFA